MKTLPLLALTAVLLATLGVGFVHGRITNRWGLRTNAETAAEHLRRRLPDEVGNWRVRSDDKLPAPVVQTLQCPAYISRVYEHQQSGDVVNVAVLLGPPGPISVHTPEVCYSSREFTQDGDRRRVKIKDLAEQEHALWHLPLKANNLDASSLRVYYGWSTGGRWDAPERPRFSFGSLPHLYKLQVAVTDHPTSEAIDFDAGQDFLECFLPQLAPQMVLATRKGAAESQ
jgi:hypothetical protein